MRVLSALLVVAIRCLSWTWRVEVVTAGDSDRENTNVIYAFLHGELLPLSVAYRGQGVHALVSQSRDGDLAAEVLSRMGYQVIRGSSSKGGPAALQAAVECLQDGGAVALAVDGPRGPRGRVSRGAATLAEQTGCLVRWVAVDASSALCLSTWDKFVIPLPFSRVRLVYGDIRATGTNGVHVSPVSDQLLEVLGSESSPGASRGRFRRALTTPDPSLAVPSRE